MNRGTNRSAFRSGKTVSVDSVEYNRTDAHTFATESEARDFCNLVNDGIGVTEAKIAVAKFAAQRAKRNANNRARGGAMRSIGMVRVKGNMGGTYWE